MHANRPGDPRITDLLAAARSGDAEAMQRLMPLVYDDLRRRAHRQLARHRRNPVLDTTGLVHEAYLRMVRGPNVAWEDRNHFFGVAVKAMRSVIVDQARRHMAHKRGGAARQVRLSEQVLRVEEDAASILAVHEAMEQLAAIDARLAALVELRFFGGLTVEESAQVLGVSDRTVKRDWTKAQALLYELIQGS